MKIIVYLVLMICCSSCIYYQKAYYVSPVNGLSNAYKNIPVQSDSVKSTYYVNAAFSNGSANDRARDNVLSVETNISAANNFKNFQAYYSTGVLLGNYKLSRYDGGNYSSTIKPQILNQYAGKKFFGAVDFSGGMNVVIPLPGGGEWRIIGVQTSLYKEFGDYLTVRKQLPDSAATFINRRNFFGTLGGYTEIIDKTKYGYFGLRISGGTVLGRDYHRVPRIDDYGYCNITLSAAVKKWCPYLQANFATKADAILIGANYRLGK